MSSLEQALEAEKVPSALGESSPQQKNPFGRKRGEQAGAEELLSGVNRQMPYSDEAEKGLISSVLQEPSERMQETKLLLPPEAFYHEGNRIVYEMLIAFNDKGLPIDPVMVTNALREQGLLDRVGGPAAITELFSFVPIPSHYQFYQEIVRRKYLLRQFIHANAINIDEAQKCGTQELDEDVGKLLASGEERVFKVLDHYQQKNGGPDILDSTKAVIEWTDAFERIVMNRGKVMGICTGWVDVDRTFHGLAPEGEGDLLMIGGFPGSGKTGAGVSLLEEIAVMQGIPTAVFPLEMGHIGVQHRLILGRAGIDISVSRNGHMQRDDYGALGRVQKEIQAAPIYWDQSSTIEVDQLRAKVTMLVRKSKVKVVIIDHFGQLKASTKAGKADERLGQKEIMECLHELRRNLGVLIIVFVQLDKAAREKHSKNRPPGNGDVRGASEMIEYPTHIAFIHRPATVLPWHALDEKKQDLWIGMTAGFRADFPEAWHDGRRLTDGRTVHQMDYEEHTRLVITKNRWGATTDDICLRYRTNLQRFVGRTLKLYSNNEKFRQVKLPGF